MLESVVLNEKFRWNGCVIRWTIQIESRTTQRITALFMLYGPFQKKAFVYYE